MPSSNYTGLPYPAPGNDAPSPAPSPGSQLVIIVPADDTPNTAANLYIQQYKTIADYVNAIQSAIKPSAPVAYGAAIGFSAVTQVGGGTGTVTPSGTAYGGQNVVIKMIAGGAVGVATFQYSLDGGATYSATSGTVPTFVIGSGISVAFSGTFSAATTYQFKCALAPTMRIVDSAGNGRFLVDHNGFDGGRFNRVDETFRVQATSATADPFTGYGQLRFNRTGTTFNYTAGVGTTSGFSGPKLQISTGATNALNDKGYVYQDGATFGKLGNSSAHVAVIEWEAQPSGLAGGNMDVFMGWSGAAPADTATDTLLFRFTMGTDTFWQCVSRKASTSTVVSSGVVPVAGGTWTRFRIEAHDSNSPLALAISAANGVALFFINDALVGFSTTNLPDAVGTGGLRPMFGFKALTANLATGLLDISPYSTRSIRVGNAVI